MPKQPRQEPDRWPKKHEPTTPPRPQPTPEPKPDEDEDEKAY